jgi:hypothetical protein
MTLDEIKAAVDAGHIVCWSNTNYEVHRWVDGSYNIVCMSNQHAIGLTWMNGVTMNGKPEDFFIRTTPKGPLE